MKRLAAQRNPKAETRDTGPETRNTLTATAAEPMEEGLAKKERRPKGFFLKMTNDRLIEYTREVMREKGITTRGGLQKADSGLRTVLRRRNLLGQVIPESANELHRDWVGMSDERIVEFTQEFMRENGITTRSGLESADRGVHSILRRRNLLDHAFAEVDETKRAKGLDAVCTALEEFGEEG